MYVFLIPYLPIDASTIIQYNKNVKTYYICTYPDAQPFGTNSNVRCFFLLIIIIQVDSKIISRYNSIKYR